jgi:Zn-dependent M28 family amino/carboxypeptidase
MKSLAAALALSLTALTQTIPERGTVQGRALTRQYLAGALGALGYTAEYHDYRTEGRNVLAKLPATSPTDEWILVGAHMDSVKNAGANDNATGSACVLELARQIKALPDRKVNVLFAFFDEEEKGLIGSTALAKKLKKDQLRVTSVHTIDMAGWDADRDRVIEIEQPDGGLWEYYQAVNARHGLGLKLVRTSSGATDHVAFRRQGFRSVGLCEEWANGDTTPYYHRKSDTFETVDLEYLASTTRFFAAVIGDLVQRVPPPPARPFIPHSFFPGRDHCGNR